jgi:hypothetical protein
MIVTADKGPGKDIKREDKYQVIRLSYNALAKLLELPEGASIVGTSDEFITNTLCIKIVGFNNKIAQEGLEITELLPTPNGWV